MHRTGRLFVAILGMAAVALPALGSSSVTKAQTPDGETVLSISGPIKVTVSDLHCWLRAQEKAPEDVRLVLGEEPGAQTSVAPYRTVPAGSAEDAACQGDGQLFFDLGAVGHTGDAWSEILANRPFLSFTSKGLPVSVALVGEAALESKAEVDITLASRYRLGAYVGSLIVLLLLLWALAKMSNIVRNVGPEPADPKRKPFSLARLQMASWFVLVVAAFLEIWILTAQLPDVPGSILALLGIAAGTFVGAEVIDSGKDRKVRASQGWYWDILRNDEGVQLHRFQSVVWTVVMMVVFVVQLHGELSMTDFTTTQLGLMGISNGLYVGFKFPESDKPG